MRLTERVRTGTAGRPGVLPGLLIAGAIGAAAGVGWGWLAPRGAVTTTQALTSMLLGLAVGLAAGTVSGSRWSLLVGPLLFTAGFELARLGAVGPTVDGIHLGSTYGIIAFVLGRLFPALLVLAPLVVGARYGVWLAHCLGRSAVAPRGVGLAALVLSTVVLFALAWVISRPASTHPIVGPDGQPLPGSIAELTTVTLGGKPQALMLRGRSTDNPVLLHLAGGPGGTDLGAMRADTSLEEHFVVVVWDQRGTGKSYAALDPVATLTLEQMVSDTLELADYLRQRFNEERIYLTGNSWGTILGTLAVQRRPDLFHAYVGTGQMVSPPETDAMFYEDTLAWAEQGGDHALVATLQRNGPPPYANLLDYEPAISHEHDWNPYPDLDMSKEMPTNLFVPENSLMDKVNGLRAFLDTFSVLYPQIQGVDLRRDAARLEVPVYLVLGAHEARGRAVPAQEWFGLLEAPNKELVIFERSGHRPSFEEPAAFAALMQRVLTETYPGE